MKVEVNLYKDGTWQKELDTSLDSPNTLITVFSTSEFKDVEAGYVELCEKFPQAIITGCSTAGEIYENEVHEGSLSVAISKFEKTKLVPQYVQIDTLTESFDRGCKLAKKFDKKGLKSLFVLSDGLSVNGSRLVEGFNHVFNSNVIITGGMASDDSKFEKAWVVVNKERKSHHVSSVGFYGENLEVDYTAEGGWKPLGVERLITSCNHETSTIYTVDNKPILELYKHYMGEQAKNLPTSGLQFPFLIIDEEGDSKTRAVWEANEESQSIRVSGDVKKGNKIVFLRGSPNYIIKGAQKAAQNLTYNAQSPTLALTISCIGRKAVLKERTVDEIEILQESFHDNVFQIGFYAYGELSPQASGKCALHNQTMTIALIWES